MSDRLMIPQPPFASAIDPTVQTWVTGFMAAAMIVALLYSLWQWRATGKPTFLLLFVGGGAMMAFEPLVDTVGGCWFPEHNSWVAFSAYGRTLPLWLCLTYFFYFGIGVGVTWQLMRRGLTRGQLWALFVGGIVGDAVLEATLLHFDTYYYYGWQPLVVFKFPLWWGPVNSLITMIAGAVVLRFETYLTSGWRQLVIIPVVLTVSAAGNTIAGWPSWLVINTDVGFFWTQVGGLVTFALSTWFMWMIVEAVAHTAAAKGPATVGWVPQTR